jgi:mono/diheme cytochrome c family protein
MLEETPAQLVKHLEHPNGWWRDMAQQILVLKQDRSVVPALRAMARTDTMLLARVHALWTLEGLGALEPALLRELMKDPDARMRVQALRASETLYKAGDRSFADDYRALARDPDTDVVIQAMLTMDVLKTPGAEDAIRATRAANPARGVQVVAEQLLKPPSISAGPYPSAEQRALVQRGAGIFRELCSQCHGETGKGTPVASGGTMAPALAGNARVQAHRDYVLQTLLHGQTGPIEGKTYEGGMMVPMAEQSDEWIAAVASYIRTNLGNEATTVSPEEVARVRAASKGRSSPWTHPALMAAVPRLLEPDSAWRATASRSAPTRVGATADPMRAFNFEGWTTGEAQAPGMWFQVELPQAVRLTEIQFESPLINGPRPAPGAPPAPQRSTAPTAYRVELSMDGRQWSAPVAEGRASGGTVNIPFVPTRARFLRITETAAREDGAPWTMERLRLYQAPGAAPE